MSKYYDPFYWLSLAIFAFFLILGTGFVTSFVLFDQGFLGMEKAPAGGCLGIVLAFSWLWNIHRPIWGEKPTKHYQSFTPRTTNERVRARLPRIPASAGSVSGLHLPEFRRIADKKILEKTGSETKNPSDKT